MPKDENIYNNNCIEIMKRLRDETKAYHLNLNQ